MTHAHDGAPDTTRGPLTQYTIYSVFRRVPGLPHPGFAADETGRASAVSEVERAITAVEADGVTVRGLYDLNGFRQDGDVLLWVHGEHPEALQKAVRRIRATRLFDDLEATWQVAGVHRAAEFNERHMPAFMYGKPPATWVTIYPFVRSYDWYLLDDAERSVMLRDHGIRGAKFTSVLANTVAAFGISDYEWMLSFESDELTDIVDMMRDLRYTEARRHVREETPFYTGRRITPAELPLALRYLTEAAAEEETGR